MASAMTVSQLLAADDVFIFRFLTVTDLVVLVVFCNIQFKKTTNWARKLLYFTYGANVREIQQLSCPIFRFLLLFYRAPRSLLN